MNKSFSVKRVALLGGGAMVLTIVLLWQFGVLDPLMPRLPANAIIVIAPYRYNGTWVFDDDRAGLVREPFVAGVPEMIDVLVKKIPNADKGFRMTFSAREFPGYDKKLTWLRGDKGGNWYRLDDPPMEGWICPAMFRYYKEAPKSLYIKADPK